MQKLADPDGNVLLTKDRKEPFVIEKLLVIPPINCEPANAVRAEEALMET